MRPVFNVSGELPVTQDWGAIDEVFFDPNASSFTNAPRDQQFAPVAADRQQQHGCPVEGSLQHGPKMRIPPAH